MVQVQLISSTFLINESQCYDFYFERMPPLPAVCHCPDCYHTVRVSPGNILICRCKSAGRPDVRLQGRRLEVWSPRLRQHRGKVWRKDVNTRDVLTETEGSHTGNMDDWTMSVIPKHTEAAN